MINMDIKVNCSYHASVMEIQLFDGFGFDTSSALRSDYWNYSRKALFVQITESNK